MCQLVLIISTAASILCRDVQNVTRWMLLRILIEVSAASNVKCHAAPFSIFPDCMRHVWKCIHVENRCSSGCANEGSTIYFCPRAHDREVLLRRLIWTCPLHPFVLRRRGYPRMVGSYTCTGSLVRKLSHGRPQCSLL